MGGRSLGRTHPALTGCFCAPAAHAICKDIMCIWPAAMQLHSRSCFHMNACNNSYTQTRSLVACVAANVALVCGAVAGEERVLCAANAAGAGIDHRHHLANRIPRPRTAAHSRKLNPVRPSMASSGMIALSGLVSSPQTSIQSASARQLASVLLQLHWPAKQRNLL